MSPAATQTPKRAPRPSQTPQKTAKAKKNETPLKTPPATRSRATPAKATPKPMSKKPMVAKNEQSEKQFATPKTNGKATPAKKAPATPRANGKAAVTKNSPQKSKNIEVLDNIVADIEKEASKSIEEPKIVEEEAESTSDEESSEVSKNDIDATDDSEESSEGDNEESENAIQKSILKSNDAAKAKTDVKKRVSFVKGEEDESSRVVPIKNYTTEAPKDLNDELALVIKGLNFKCTAQDVKKRLEKAHYIRMPMNSAKPNQNNGYCIVYFKEKEDMTEAYESMRKNSKILAREVFTRFLKPKTADKLADREIDPKCLYITNWPKSSRSETYEDAHAVFPEAILIYVKYFHNRPTAIIRFKDAVSASKYFNKTVKYQGQLLKIQKYYKANSATKRNNDASAQVQSNAKRQKVNDAPQTKKIMDKKEEVAKLQLEESSEEENSSSDEMTTEGVAVESTDSEDESIEEESSE